MRKFKIILLVNGHLKVFTSLSLFIDKTDMLIWFSPCTGFDELRTEKRMEKTSKQGWIMKYLDYLCL